MLAVGLSILASIAYVALMIVIFFVGWALAMYVLAGLVMAMRLAVAVAKEVISYAGKPFSTVKNKTSKIVRNARVQARKRRLVAEKREQVRARLQPQAA
ncbi:MAG TPA: hypothetical protein VJ742_12570 [Nitrososphaera sp.]|nr:hypothetical protein [Nitrososphaera sp.]